MTKISVVIISYNAAHTIEPVLKSALSLSDDVIVVDSNSEDQTKEICKRLNVQFQKQDWLGYGKQKNVGNALAKNNWILSLDADEVLSEELITEIKNTPLHAQTVYSIPFINIYCGAVIKYGRWRNEKHVRIFNKTTVAWDENPVHEGLQITNHKIVKLTHHIYHYSMNSKQEHLDKAKRYAEMGALKLHAQDKKASFLKLYINPIFRFVKDYFFSLGFLDGKLGLQIATIISKETFWKYQNLKNLRK